LPDKGLAFGLPLPPSEMPFSVRRSRRRLAHRGVTPARHRFRWPHAPAAHSGDLSPWPHHCVTPLPCSPCASAGRSRRLGDQRHVRGRPRAQYGATPPTARSLWCHRHHNAHNALKTLAGPAAHCGVTLRAHRTHRHSLPGHALHVCPPHGARHHHVTPL